MTTTTRLVGADPLTIPPTLFHYTCDHAAASILAAGALLPYPHPFLSRVAPLVWLTSDPAAARYDLGLTSDLIECDRMAHRFRVIDSTQCLPWRVVSRLAPSGVIEGDVIRLLELNRDVTSWWVSPLPVAVVLG